MTHPFASFDSILAFGKDNAEALAQSGAASLKVWGDLTRAHHALVSRSVDQADAAVKAWLAVKSPNELVELNNRLVRDSIEQALSEGRALADLGTQAVSAVLEPLNVRFHALKDTARAA